MVIRTGSMPCWAGGLICTSASYADCPGRPVGGPLQDRMPVPIRTQGLRRTSVAGPQLATSGSAMLGHYRSNSGAATSCSMPQQAFSGSVRRNRLRDQWQCSREDFAGGEFGDGDLVVVGEREDTFAERAWCRRRGGASSRRGGWSSCLWCRGGRSSGHARDCPPTPGQARAAIRKSSFSPTDVV